MSKQLITITIQIPLPAKSWFRFSLSALAALNVAVALIAAAYTWNRPVRYIDLLDGAPYSRIQLDKLEQAFGAAGLNSYRIMGDGVLVPYDEQFEYREVANKL